MAIYLFLTLLAAHIVYSLVSNRWYEGPQPTGRLRLVHAWLQGPLLWVAVYIAWHNGVFSRQLVSPVYIGLGLAAGHLIFGLSLLMTHLSWRDATSHFFDLSSLWNFTVESPVVLTRFLGVALGEEVIWRAVAQPVVIQELSRFLPDGAATAAGILAVAVAFVIVHKHFFENSLHVSLEFACFAVVLGVLYFWTASLALVIAIHALRDIEIAYIEYLMKVEELDGDKAKAAQAIEQAYQPGRPGSV